MKKAPKDQGLFLTVFVSVSVFAILIVWALLPVVHIQTEEGEDEEAMVANPRVNINLVMSPEELMEKSIVSMEKAKKVIEMDEEKKDEKSDEGENGEKKDPGKAPADTQEKG